MMIPFPLLTSTDYMNVETGIVCTACLHTSSHVLKMAALSRMSSSTTLSLDEYSENLLMEQDLRSSVVALLYFLFS